MTEAYSQIFEVRIFTKTADKVLIDTLTSAIKQTTKASIKNHLKLFLVESIMQEGKYCIDLKCINQPDSYLEKREKESDNAPEFLEHLLSCMDSNVIGMEVINKILFMTGIYQFYLYYNPNSKEFTSVKSS